jgi:hypothetical protein
MDLLLKNAIKRIEQKYFERKERDFAYELYHQLRLLELPNKTEVTCEHPKHRINFNDAILQDKLIKKSFFRDGTNENKRIYRYPDLLIHEFENRDQQLLAVEIKKRGNANQIRKDLAKLVVYCRGELNYKKGILIIIQPFDISNQVIEVPEIREMLRNYSEVEIWTVCPQRINVYNSLNT